jgi:Fis family transcriptional regulator
MEKGFEGLVECLFNGNVSLQEAVELLERSMIGGALKASGGNQSAASRQLRIHRNTLQRKMLEYGLGGTRVRSRRKPVARQGRPRKRGTGAA